MTTRKETQYGSSKCADAVWDHAKPIRGRDPSEYRKDPTGATIRHSAYGSSEKGGWQIDHIKPQSRGGSDALRNLQALNSATNMSKGNSLVKPSRHSKSNK